MNIYKEMMRKTFKKLCIHSRKYKLSRPIKYPDKEGFYCFGKTIMFPELFEGWDECESCILRTIQWAVPHSMGKINRDVCFAIWHNGIFDSVV